MKFQMNALYVLKLSFEIETELNKKKNILYSKKIDVKQPLSNTRNQRSS